MKIRNYLLLAFTLTVAVSSAEDLKMWYQAPAREWMEAVPLGNGRIGAMVYGGINTDRVALNEITLWAGQRDSLQNDYCGPENLATIRQAFFDGDLVKGNQLAREYLNGRNSSFGTHLPLGDMVMEFTHPSDKISDYRRELDLETGVAYTKYTVATPQGPITYTRQYICSYPDDVMAINVTADRPGSVTMTLGTDFLRGCDKKATNDGNLYFDGVVDYPMFGPGGVAFAGDFRMVPQGGKVSANDGKLTVSGADAVTILFDMRTNYDNLKPMERVNATLDKAQQKGYSKILDEHWRDHNALFSRMDIDLGNSINPNLPTDKRLHLAKAGVVDPGFDALFFQYGRYMQIASSRPNSVLCSNLQGIWNDNLACQMSWTCDYHLDININQNYWSANKANLAECNEPMFKYVALLAKYGSETASKLYGCNGWCAHTVTNPWGYTANGGDISWGLNVSAGAWLATELWSHYLYTLDDEYLNNVGYPLLKSCAEFFVDYMVEDPATGYLVTGPSISPENGFYIVGDNDHHYNAAMMPTLDRCIVEQIYTACIRSSEILGIDKKFRQRLQKDLKRLPPVQVGTDGQINEWLMYDSRRSDPSHRHTSQLMGLYPFGQFTYTKTPELMEASKKTLESQTSHPNWEDTEWSTGNMLCFNAFLRDADKAHSWLQNLFKTFTRENLMTVSPKGIAGAPADIFSFDATEASVAGICDMLLQSHDGCIELLPALPSAWPEGHVNGLCAQGAFTVDLAWKDGKAVKTDIHCGKDNTLRLKVDQSAPTITIEGKTVTLKMDGDIACIAMKKGQSASVRF